MRTMPTCSPLGPTSRTSGTRIRSLMRGSTLMGPPREYGTEESTGRSGHMERAPHDVHARLHHPAPGRRMLATCGHPSATRGPDRALAHTRDGRTVPVNPWAERVGDEVLEPPLADPVARTRTVEVGRSARVAGSCPAGRSRNAARRLAIPSPACRVGGSGVVAARGPRVERVFGWLDHLNDEQRTAVTYDGGPLLILAGAGTGKTTTLTGRRGVARRGRRPGRADSAAHVHPSRGAGDGGSHPGPPRRPPSLGPRARRHVSRGRPSASCARTPSALGLPEGFGVLDPSDAVDVLDLVRDDAGRRRAGGAGSRARRPCSTSTAGR